MKEWVRRIRAAIGMGFTWGVAWFGAGIVLALVSGFDADVPFPLLFALLGFTAGIIFSGLLAVTERRRRFDQVSLRGFAWRGAMGGLLLSGLLVVTASLGGENLWGEVLVLAPVFALAGAVCAAGSLAVAKRAERGELADNSADTAAAELTNDEKRELPGGGSDKRA